MADATTTRLVEEMQTAVAAAALDLPRVARCLDSLLQYLCSPGGRTDANCRFVDSFFMEHDEWAERGLPDALHDLFADIAGALHDTCSAPHIARNFDSTPEQLLQRLRTMNTEPDASPNGGPAARFGNSEVSEGPPSVS
ncbi:MAG: hypothetical protein ACLQU3_12280 [Limisphaerales bacterium]